ncbi:MAG: FAD-dependent oxidoreductase, partial [Specibacter sp.]
MDADVVIIGGGIAGLSLAWRLAPTLSVVVVEAEETLAFHSSSRSARQMQPSYGPDPIQELTRRSIALVQQISAGLPTPILKPRPLLTLGSESEVRALVGTNANLVAVEQADAMLLSTDLRPEVFEAAALDGTSMEVDVPALIDYYRSQALAAGAVILTGAPVQAAATNAGGGFAVVAGVHVISAATVVNAAGAWADTVAALFRV